MDQSAILSILATNRSESTIILVECIRSECRDSRYRGADKTAQGIAPLMKAEKRIDIAISSVLGRSQNSIEPPPLECRQSKIRLKIR